MRKETERLVSYLENEKGFPKNVTPSLGEIVDGMVTRSPRRKNHIYSVIRNLKFSKSEIDTGMEKNEDMFEYIFSGQFGSDPMFKRTVFGKVKLAKVMDLLALDFDFDTGKSAHIELLSHELGHGIHRKIDINKETGDLEVRVNCHTRKNRIITTNKTITTELVSEHAKAVGEAVNNFNSVKLLEMIYGKWDYCKGHSHSTRATTLIEQLCDKYNIAGEVFECDEQLDYGILREAIDKKTRVNSALFRKLTPAEVLYNYCEEMHTAYIEKFKNPIDDYLLATEKPTEQVREYFRL